MTQLTKTQDFVRFSGKVILVHTLTYLIFGGLAMAIFDYPSLWKLPYLADSYRPMDSHWVHLGALLQPLRAILYSAVLWLIRPFYLEKKRGWLYIWLIFLGFAIFGTSGAPSGSFEGFIYLKWPVWLHLIFLPEIVLQTLAFSYLLFHWDTSSQNNHSSKAHLLGTSLRTFFYSLTYTLIGMFGVMVTGIISLWILGLSIKPGETSSSALLVLGGVALANMIMAFYLYTRGWKSQGQFTVIAILIYLINSLPYAMHNLIIQFPVGFIFTMINGIFPSLILIFLTYRIKMRNIER